MIDSLIAFDKEIFHVLNGSHNQFMDSVMWYISGKLTFTPLYLFIIWWIFKKNGLKNGFIALGIMISAIAASDLGSVYLFKEVFQRLRPCHDPSMEGLVIVVNNKCGGLYSFISSHASNTFTLAVFSSLFFKNKFMSLSILIWAAIVSYSRIYLGVHYPFDIIGGMIWGSLIGYIFYKIYSFFINSSDHIGN